MFELFPDTFKCGFIGKVKVKFKVKYEKKCKKDNLRYYHLLFHQNLQEWEEVLYTKVNYNVKALIISNKNLTKLCFHGDIQDGV